MSFLMRFLRFLKIWGIVLALLAVAIGGIVVAFRLVVEFAALLSHAMSKEASFAITLLVLVAGIVAAVIHGWIDD